MIDLLTLFLYFLETLFVLALLAIALLALGLVHLLLFPPKVYSNTVHIKVSDATAQELADAADEDD